MADIALLYGLGVRLVVVLGVQTQIDATLRAAGSVPRFVGAYRVTDDKAMEAAIEAAGRARTAVEQFLSRGPSVPVIRRHAKGDTEMHFGPALRVISGNYVAAKRRGIIDGVDFGYTGEVRFIAKDAAKNQLEQNNIVLLSNLGFTAAGEVLNCNTYDVGLHAAVELGADKLFCLHLDDVAGLKLPPWLPLSAAKDMLLSKIQSQTFDPVKASRIRSLAMRSLDMDNPDASAAVAQVLAKSGKAAAAERSAAARLAAAPVKERDESLVNLDVWQAHGFPTGVSACVVACSKGVKRAHLVDARLDGGILLELYSRDGIGTMISTDFYEGIRGARSTDLDAIMGLLEPLVAAGVLVKRSRQDLARLVPHFTVLERETKVMGCCLLLPLGCSPDGLPVAEMGAFCVDPAFRGSGRGDSLLDYVEQDARQKGIQRIVLLTTRTADWFLQRDFKHAGPAFASPYLPEDRKARIDASRNSQLYVKDLECGDGELHKVEPGKRIGF